jgi:hypothetical protein
MTKSLNVNHRKIFFALCFASLLLAITLSLSVRTNSQQLHSLNQPDKPTLLSQVESAAEVPFNVVENDDSPFKITEAKVKEISGPEFTKLTGKTTDLVTVSSVPEVKLINTSGKTITSFFMVIRNAKARSVCGFIQSKVSIAPGQSYTVERERFANPEKVTMADNNGVRQIWVQPKFDSERYWLDFEKSPDVFVTVAQVSFDDGTEWRVKEGGRVR